MLYAFVTSYMETFYKRFSLFNTMNTYYAANVEIAKKTYAERMNTLSKATSQKIKLIAINVTPIFYLYYIFCSYRKNQFSGK